MNVAILDIEDDIKMLMPIGLEWKEAAHGVEYGLPINEHIASRTLEGLKNRNDGDVLVLLNQQTPIGFMGLSYRNNHVGEGLIANECLFYVSQAFRSGGIRLKNAAKKLAKEKGCNFIVWNASRIAGDGDRSGAFYERSGAKHFESSYLEVL